MKVEELLHTSRMRLEKARVNEASINAEYLVSFACGFERKNLFFELDRECLDRHISKLEKYIFRKIKGEPLSWIIGEHDFCGLKIKIEKGVFTPRPETEELAELVLKESKKIDSPLILDYCCGSGCISLFIAHKNPKAKVISVDVSKKAVSCARKNAEFLNLKNIKIIESSNMPSYRKFDLIVSNPPYVPEDLIDNLDVEVRLEPRRALSGGRDGLYMIRYIEKKARFLLKKGGKIYMEFGFGQEEEIRRLFSSSYKDVLMHKDMQGKYRFLEAVNG